MPTRYEFVPGPVIGPGLGATIRRTSGESALQTPGASVVLLTPRPRRSRRCALLPRDESRGHVGSSRSCLYASVRVTGTDPRRSLPSVQWVLDALDPTAPFHLRVSAARDAVDNARAATEAGDTRDRDAVVDDARTRLGAARRALLGPVVNATGVLLHTNLGRAPLAE